MGGLISMYALCEYPRIFGAAACLSTHWSGIFTDENPQVGEAFLKYLAQKAPSPKRHRFYFDFGTATLDTLYEPFQLKADSILQSKGFKGKKFMSRKFEGENHTESAWNKRLSIPVLFLLGKVE
jgi:enterochelin esterase-like enzyme